MRLRGFWTKERMVISSIVVIIIIGGVFSYTWLMMPPPTPTITEQQAVDLGREFLDEIVGEGRTGKVLSIKLLEASEIPDGYLYYWHNLAGLEEPDVSGLKLCWLIRFEQAHRPGHFFDVLVNAHTGQVIGGMQCR